MYVRTQHAHAVELWTTISQFIQHVCTYIACTVEPWTTISQFLQHVCTYIACTVELWTTISQFIQHVRTYGMHSWTMDYNQSVHTACMYVHSMHSWTMDYNQSVHTACTYVRHAQLNYSLQSVSTVSCIVATISEEWLVPPPTEMRAMSCFMIELDISSHKSLDCWVQSNWATSWHTLSRKQNVCSNWILSAHSLIALNLGVYWYLTVWNYIGQRVSILEVKWFSLHHFLARPTQTDFSGYGILYSEIFSLGQIFIIA